MKHHRPYPAYPPQPCSPPIHPQGCGCPDCMQHMPQPCPPPDCRWDGCAPPSCPPHACHDAQRFLLPRIISSGRTWLRRECFTLHLDGLPSCLQMPLMLISVAASGEAPQWEPLPDAHPGQMRLHICIPLTCQVRDCSGCTYTAHATIEVDACLRLQAPQCECWRSTLMLLPCVRLVCPPPCADSPCFDVQLEVLVEAYLTRWEACTRSQHPERC